jgi:hypothetical protein
VGVRIAEEIGEYVFYQCTTHLKELHKDLHIAADLMFVDPCIIVQFIQKDPTGCNNVSKFIIPYLHEAQHVSGDTDGGRCQEYCA